MASNINYSTVIELRNNNPYYYGFLTQVSDTELLLESSVLKYNKNSNDRFYQVTEGDTIWDIAFAAYGDSKLWWVIAKVNELEQAFYLDIGNVLLIPDLSIIQILNEQT